MSSFLHSVDILTQVFVHLDIPSMLAVRLSCKTFHSVTKTRQFWYNRVSQLIKTHYVSPPEENLEDYNVDELEQWVRRRCRARDAFADPRLHFREQTLDLEDYDLLGAERESLNSKLIPGGRWLLIGHPPAIVHFIDLDSPDPSPRLLFDFSEVDDEIHEVDSEEVESFNFSIWIDRGSPRLSFRLAFSLLTYVSRIYISQVDLVGHGANATLVASNNAILRNPNMEMEPMCTALNDSYVVQVWNLNGDVSDTRFGVYDYRQALSCGDYLMSESDERPIVVIVFENDMEFIHKDIFAMSDIKSHSLSVYEIGPSASLNLLHRVDVYTPLWSTVRWTPGASIITTMNVDRTELRGVVIPHDSSHPPTIVVLGRCNGEKSSEYRLGTRVFVVKGKIHEIFSYDWDFHSPVNHERTLTSRRVDFSASLLPFDEDIGRFLSYTSEMQLVINDII